MAWTTPRDWTGISDDIVTAAMLNVDVRDNLGVLSTHLTPVRRARARRV